MVKACALSEDPVTVIAPSRVLSAVSLYSCSLTKASGSHSRMNVVLTVALLIICILIGSIFVHLIVTQIRKHLIDVGYV